MKNWKKVLLNIIITPGIVSVSVHSDYVGGIAHALFYGLTRRRQIEENYLHGDVVAYGTLVNLMVDRDWVSWKRLIGSTVPWTAVMSEGFGTYPGR